MQITNYCFNNVIFCPLQRTLSLERSTVVQLDPKVADLLLFLIQHHTQILSREEILNALWEGQNVSDHVVTQAISELRKALDKIDPEAKQWVKTISKRGYCFDVNATIVERNNSSSDENTSEIYAEANSVNTTKKTSLLFKSVSMLVIIVAALATTYILINHNTGKAESKIKTTILNPERMSFLVFDSTPDLDFMAFGLSDFLNYRLNTASELHSTLVFNPQSELLTTAGTILKGRLFRDKDETYVEIVMHNNINNSEMFRKTYPMSYNNLIDTPEDIVQDILPVMNEQPAPEKLAIAKERYPAALPEISWMHQAHYALNQSSPESLSKSVALYGQVLTRYPELEIPVAEQLIAIKLLRDMGDKRFSLEDLIAKNNKLTEVKTDSPPPVLHEAKAIFHFNINDLSIAQFHLNQATKIRESWLSNVIAGKIHESNGFNFKAGQAYAKAYSMKPDQGTLIAVEHLLFKTDVNKMLHFTSSK